ncbi:unnamed protein product [Protopolystoma xenopodis]|uniref:Uncharacterized protein n=1 Tax=Protopolystoma xenopodis TaxID=117903 RepID=A0A448XNS2_9PLAT|nr:unnamed protein product [Protopolystoma xenopodis]
MAIHHSASRCVGLMLSLPYNWSPDDHITTFGATPRDLAEDLGYLPTWFTVASRSIAVRRVPFSQPPWHGSFYFG